MIVVDFEVFKHDWLVCWLDTDTRKMHSIVNDKAKFEKFYEYYKNTVWVTYNGRGYDQWIAKAILCDFDPYDMSSWIIEKGRKGFEYSKLLYKFPINVYDASVGFRSLKELEAFMGHNIKESDVSFTLNRPLTNSEIQETIKYCKHDVMETFEVFMETINEYESHVGLMQEFNLTLDYISKTKAQISAVILGAVRKEHDDEFDISFPDTMDLGKYKHVADWYTNWKENVQDYKKSLVTNVCGVPHTFAFGGIHGSRDNYVGEGIFLMADVGSYYPALMIEYNLLSRNVGNPEKYRAIRDERIRMKKAGDPKEYPRKIVLNSTFGASKDRFNNLYDPRNANNICIYGQLLLLDLLDKLEGKCDLIQSNTDGILLKLYSENDVKEIMDICEEWSKRTRMTLDYDRYTKVIQKDVNNYILVDDKGNVKSKGSYVKKLKNIDRDMPIVNRAIKNYFVSGQSVESTVMSATDMVDFQKVHKIGKAYEYTFLESSKGSPHTYIRYKNKQRVRQGVVVHKWSEPYKDIVFGNRLNTKVNRIFASNRSSDGMLMKKNKDKEALDKLGLPDKCFLINDSIEGMEVPSYVDRQWYIDLAKSRIQEFLGKNR